MTRRLVFGLVLLALVFTIGAFVGTWVTLSRYPRCQEEIVLAGQGRYKNGRWDYYVCGPSFDDWKTLEPEHDVYYFATRIAAQATSTYLQRGLKATLEAP